MVDAKLRQEAREIRLLEKEEEQNETSLVEPVIPLAYISLIFIPLLFPLSW